MKTAMKSSMFATLFFAAAIVVNAKDEPTTEIDWTWKLYSNQACDTICKEVGKFCVEGHWPNTEEKAAAAFADADVQWPPPAGGPTRGCSGFATWFSEPEAPAIPQSTYMPYLSSGTQSCFYTTFDVVTCDSWGRANNTTRICPCANDMPPTMPSAPPTPPPTIESEVEWVGTVPSLYSCDDACSERGKVCTENHWPNTLEKAKAAYSAYGVLCGPPGDGFVERSPTIMPQSTYLPNFSGPRPGSPLNGGTCRYSPDEDLPACGAISPYTPNPYDPITRICPCILDIDL